MLMHHGRDEDSIRLYFVKNCERKARDQSLADVCSFDWTGFGELLDAAGCLVDGGEKIRAKTFRSCFVEPCRFDCFFGSFRMEDSFHRLRASRALRKTSSAGNALNLPAAKFFKSSLSLSKPQRFGITLNLIVNR